MQQEPLTLERTFNAPVERVWRAITDKDHMKQWYFDLPEFKAEVGFEFSFRAGKTDRVFLHLCRVTEVEPNKKLTYSWQYEEFPGNSFVTFELFPEGDKTRLKLTHAGLETFGDSPEVARGNFETGWTMLIGTKLKEYVEKAAVTEP
ncbi:SRPBCC domain-containing protein [Chitinophaga agrisoli]|uniref:SRPBCC domain-containing protein n=1 Tax=Chitinophaga agrisoli TaxID=2607653 RepID=A0A5B2VYA4_9BACT|nr:SRPBCC domain-containing protein [Chitinophaga agrisoli]KAA2243618.1 SRPBCC domain-containing protein [Chitinophaga agrisoli]